MSDRQSFLNAIMASFWDALPRLVFADWLEEYGSGDLDAATVEYIRLSCGVPKEGAGSRKALSAESLWLRGNWKRLVPTLTREFDNFPDEGPCLKQLCEAEQKIRDALNRGDLDGSARASYMADLLQVERHTRVMTWQRWKTRTQLQVGIPITVGCGDVFVNGVEVTKTYVPSVQLEFGRGFVRRAQWQAPRLGPKTAGMIAKDQPLAIQTGPGAIPTVDNAHE